MSILLMMLLTSCFGDNKSGTKKENKIGNNTQLPRQYRASQKSSKSNERDKNSEYKDF